MTLRTGTILRIAFSVERDSCPVWRNLRQCAVGNFLRVRAVNIGDKNLFIVFIGDFTLCRADQPAQRNTNKQAKSNSLHFELERAHAWKARILDQAF